MIALANLRAALFEKCGSTRPLAAFRILLIILLWSRFAGDLALWNTSSIAEILLGLAFYILTIASLIGWHTRRAMALLAGVLALLYFHFGFRLGHQPWTHHHVYLLVVCTVLCAIGPCDRSFSLDRWRALKANQHRPEQGHLIANHLIRLQLAAVYFWTAYDKTNFDFLSGARLDQILHFHYAGTVIEPLILWPPLITLAAISVVAVEYFLAVAIIFRRWLSIALILGFGLHLAFYYLLPVSTFSLTMMLMYIMVLPTQKVHVFFEIMLSSKNGKSIDTT